MNHPKSCSNNIPYFEYCKSERSSESEMKLGSLLFASLLFILPGLSNIRLAVFGGPLVKYTRLLRSNHDCIAGWSI
jgi:hypothetical protein